MRDIFPENIPALVLAPMQDVTDLPFMKVMQGFGGPDYYVTEYFRVYENSPLSKYILRSITENQTNRPIFAQMIGQDIPSLLKTSKQLQQYPIAGIDLNLGCPAPVVCRKDAGGGLLRKPEKIKAILGALRENIDTRFTVKTRIGYESEEEFDQLLDLFSQFEIDTLSIHARTVKERYQSPVHPERILQAVNKMQCPVIANGNVVNKETGINLLKQTKAAGLMIGRGAIRNPWIFQQLRNHFQQKETAPLQRKQLLHYIQLLFDAVASEWTEYDEKKHVNKMKKYLVYIAQGIDESFEYQIRRVQNKKDFHEVCVDHLKNETPLPDCPPEKSKLFCGFKELLNN